MGKKEQKKKTLKTDVIIGAYVTLKKGNLELVETFTDRLRISDGVRLMGAVKEDFESKRANREDMLKPSGFDELREKLRAEAKEKKQQHDPKEVMKFNVMVEEYNAQLLRSEKDLLDEEREIELPEFATEVIHKVLEGNAKWTAEQMIAVMDALG